MYLTYLGVDETSLGIGGDNLIIAAAETRDKRLIKDQGYASLDKAKDILEKARAYNRKKGSLYYENIPELCSPDKMEGLEDFHWMRARGGRFSRQIVEHASIAQVVSSNGYAPQRTVIFIDEFHRKGKESQYIIHEYLKRSGFEIPAKNIEIVPGGDKRIPIINYADLLAFQIGLWMNERYRQFFPQRVSFPLEPHSIEYDENRVESIVSRDRLEDVVRYCRRKARHSDNHIN